MKLRGLAYPLEYGGETRLVIEDEPLLGWASEMGLPSGTSQIIALEEEIIPLRYLKNFFA